MPMLTIVMIGAQVGTSLALNHMQELPNEEGIHS